MYTNTSVDIRFVYLFHNLLLWFSFALLAAFFVRRTHDLLGDRPFARFVLQILRISESLSEALRHCHLRFLQLQRRRISMLVVVNSALNLGLEGFDAAPRVVVVPTCNEFK